jgi:hypothetical protein
MKPSYALGSRRDNAPHIASRHQQCSYDSLNLDRDIHMIQFWANARPYDAQAQWRTGLLARQARIPTGT